MANRNLFQSIKEKLQPKAVRNEAGGRAYLPSAAERLALLTATGCLNNTFYADAEAQLEQALQLCAELDAEFIARTAVYSRQQNYLKDLPALLLAVLANRDVALFARVFPLICDNGKMLRNFAQIIRSGSTGRKSFGSKPKQLLQRWLLTASEKQLLNASIGTRPSLADLVKMVHPRPTEKWREAWFGWLLGKDYDAEALPPITRDFERYKKVGGEIPAVPFQMLTALELDKDAWSAIARQSSWQQLRQNLNTLERHGVLQDKNMVQFVADKLSDAEAIARARVFPYQLLTTAQATGALPAPIGNALEEAMEMAVANVPALRGRVYLCPDVSGSMQSSVTGYRRGATSATRCIDVAGLMTAAILRHNRHAQVLPFDTQVRSVKLDARQRVMVNAQNLARINGGGTACSAPLKRLNQERAEVDLIIMISDNESWADLGRHGETSLQYQWRRLKERCPRAKLVCIDIQPYTSVQAKTDVDVLNIGGFSDNVFDLISKFYVQGLDGRLWVDEINRVELPK